jgi:hypothetical protein
MEIGKVAHVCARKKKAYWNNEQSIKEDIYFMYKAQSLEYLRNRINLKDLASHLGIQVKVKDNQCWFVCPQCLELKASFQKN